MSDPMVPRVGLEFHSMDVVYDFYSNYAKQTGFRVRKGKQNYSKLNGNITGKYFLCSCEGKKSMKQIEKLTGYKRPDKRTGCGAYIKCVVRDRKWKISEVVLEHNQECLAINQGRAEDSCAMMVHSTDKIVDEARTVGEQALASDVGCSDVSQGTRKNQTMLEPKDTQDLIDHFKNRQIEDPSFFYTAQVKAASGMANFFWRDSRSKIDYEHFGDVLVLETTGINKYDMICAVFWGLNHHRQCIIFGCAFLMDQTVSSLNWLLQSFLGATSSHKPQTIITEPSEEIADALRVVLPKTSHCLSFWSILNGFRKNLPALSYPSSVDNLFMECIFHVHSREEFESKWNFFVGKYKLHEHRWLASLYRMHEKWSHAFTKNMFSAGLISIQNDENACTIFEDLSCDTMTLSQIAQWCERMAKDMCRKESLEDMHCEKISANLQSRIPVEKEAERLYTRPIFDLFREELSNILSLAIEEIGGKATVREFKLTEQGSTKTNIVKFEPSNSTLLCSCGKFESVGILCFHSLKVLNFMNIFHIPPRYLLKRWTKSAKDSLPMDTPSAGTACDGGSDNLFMGEFMRQASHVAHMSVNEKRKRVAMAIMKEAFERIAKVPKMEEVTVALDNSESNDDMDQTI
ncbi:hypothetical protein BT93_L3031 [Corymbia citriodora subsp. variegata]|uniref:Protein FAR1-RELATED SEQUENCE n=1 Tax=Corymbia citriodora subsp. variegata TaxID=360336 RepID=A0A8T0CZQ1_CORYI|nr:hypothetical protein BT93_L3031 [Corymbia citriodora subsp. variegata]